MILGSTEVPKHIGFQLLLFIHGFDNEGIIISDLFKYHNEASHHFTKIMSYQ